ncbi:MAG: hypothetical protein H6739_38505 [Alphaproteobacteria bacterium]|nr:hypothetical protein [Alphaproteobacteria bacterium]
MSQTPSDFPMLGRLIKHAAEAGANESEVMRALAHRDFHFFLTIFIRDDGILDKEERAMLEWLQTRQREGTWYEPPAEP